jgi:hypothetical protein
MSRWCRHPNRSAAKVTNVAAVSFRRLLIACRPTVMLRWSSRNVRGDELPSPTRSSADAYLPAVEFLFDWSVDRPESTDPSYNGELAIAAETVILAVQRELLERDSPLEPEVGFELGYARAWAIEALKDVSSAGAAKKTELRLTNGAPLTICTGFTQLGAAPFLGSIVDVPVIHRGEARVLRIPAPGCFAIFPDTTQTSRKAWRHWCDDCRPRMSQRPRKIARAHRRIVSGL